MVLTQGASTQQRGRAHYAVSMTINGAPPLTSTELHMLP